MNIGVVGATGIVGEEFLKLLETRNFPLESLKLFASKESKGKQLRCQDKFWTVHELHQACFKDLDLVFFSSGEDISKEWGPKALAEGAFAIDNSSAFRMDPDIALIIPEVNGELLPKSDKPSLIANPNCSTIQLVLVLAPLMRDFGLSQVKVATYQSVSGAGKLALDELVHQTQCKINGQDLPPAQTFSHPIAFNCLPQIGGFNEEGYTSEEMKIIKESQKILGRPDLKMSAFAVRVPTFNGHSEAAWVTLGREVSREQVLNSISSSETLVLFDDPRELKYPTLIEASGNDPVYVGRLHRDLSDPLTWLMWIVADNLRVGAALNGIRIAERIFELD